MPQNPQQPVYPVPSTTALWLARLSIGLLIGTALWLMGFRTHENRERVGDLHSKTAELRFPQPTQ
jgi:hypothetical protein